MRVLTCQHALDDRLAADYIEELAREMGSAFNAEIARTSPGIRDAWEFPWFKKVYYWLDDSRKVGTLEIP